MSLAESMALSSPNDMRGMHNHVMFFWILCALGVNGCSFIDCQIESIITQSSDC